MYIQNNLGSYGGLGSVWGDASDKTKDIETRSTDSIDPQVARKRKLGLKPSEQEVRDKRPESSHPLDVQDAAVGVRVRDGHAQTRVSRPLIPAEPPFPPKKVRADYYLHPSSPIVSTEQATDIIVTAANRKMINASSNNLKIKIPQGKAYWKPEGAWPTIPVYSKTPVKDGIPAELVAPLIYVKKPVFVQIPNLPKLNLPPISNLGDYLNDGLGEFGVSEAVEVGTILAVLCLLLLGVCHYNKRP